MADRYGLTWVSPDYHSWNITSLDWVAGIRAGGISGLVGEADDVALSAPGVPGQVLDSQQIPPMRGTLRFAVRGDHSESTDDVWARLRKTFHHSRPGTLVLSNTTFGTLSTKLRRNGAIPPPAVDPSSEDVILDVDVPVISDEGCWWTQPITDEGFVNVTNTGDVLAWPEILWEGVGGEVTMPSGATFTLPTADGARRLLLDTFESNVVLDADGNVDDDLWAAVRGLPAEGVPPGKSRDYILPEGARLEWSLGVLDPWQ